MNIKQKLKSFKFIYNINARIKEYLLINAWKKLEIKYALKTKDLQNLSEDQIFEEVKKKLSNRIDYKKKYHIIWVGTDENQDKSGFAQALENIFNVSYFYNSEGMYGLKNTNKKNQTISFSSKIAIENGNLLIRRFEELNSKLKVDFVFGQMMANYISKESLEILQKLNIPIFNISMDDKLPINWSIKENIKLGAIGIADFIDLTFTTTPEVCKWYINNKTVFMPLGSNYDLYKDSINEQYQRPIDVLFIGNNYGIRGELISYLEKNGINISSWGNGFKNGHADFNKSIQLMKMSKIILGFATLGYCRNRFTLKLRDFDGPMSGAMYITQKNELLASLFNEDEEIVFYKDANDCLKKIKYYLENDVERKEIALKGNIKCKNQYNWEFIIRSRFKKLGFNV